jgi:hypothetical protein
MTYSMTRRNEGMHNDIIVGLLIDNGDCSASHVVVKIK